MRILQTSALRKKHGTIHLWRTEPYVRIAAVLNFY